MRSISAQEISALVTELKGLEGFYIDRFYETGERAFRLKLARRGEQENLKILLSKTINKTIYLEKEPVHTGFSGAMRKWIENCVIDSISQLNGDRIVAFALHKGPVKLNMIVEMFGKGNLVLADGNMRIIAAYLPHEFKDRMIKNGETYKPPANTREASAAWEVTAAPVVYRKDGRVVDYSLGPLEKYAGLEVQNFNSLGTALDLFYHEAAPQKEGEDTHKKEREQAAISIERQQDAIKRIEKEMDASKTAGGALMANMQLINKVLEAARANKRITKEELQALFPQLKILNVNLKDKKIEIEL